MDAARWTHLRQHFAIDTRGLAVLRITAGALLLVDLAFRVVYLEAFYTDAGAVPRSIVPTRILSIHALSGHIAWQALLFLLHATAATALMLGLRTRTANAVALALLVSLQARNPFLLQAGDILLTLTLWWMLFLPLDGHYALRPHAAPAEAQGLAAAALLVQPVLVYTTNLVFKLEAGSWTDGQAMLYAMVDLHTTALGDVLAGSPELLTTLGQAWFLLLVASPLLLVLRGHARGAVALALAGGHLGMLAAMRLGTFPLASLAALLPFIPRPWWDVLTNRRPERSDTGPSPPQPTRGPSPSGMEPRHWRTGILVVAMAVNISFSAWGVGWIPAPDPVEEVLEGNERAWAMFARPPRSQVWYVAPTQDGTLDLLSHGPVPWERPADLGPFPDIRWRKYLSRLDDADGAPLVEPLLDYLCRQAHEAAPGTAEVTLVRLVLPRGDASPQQQPVALHTCPQP